MTSNNNKVNNQFSLDLVHESRQHLQFLQAIHKTGVTLQPYCRESVRRYQELWLPLVASHDQLDDQTVIPPADIAWIWHCHRLAPIAYETYCVRRFGRLLEATPPFVFQQQQQQDGTMNNDYDDSGGSSDGGVHVHFYYYYKSNDADANHNDHDYYETAATATRTLWSTFYGSLQEPFFPSTQHYRQKYPRVPPLVVAKYYDLQKSAKNNQLAICNNITASVQNQASFWWHMSKPPFQREAFLVEGVRRYLQFLQLLVPTYQIELIWHTHSLSCSRLYKKDCLRLCGQLLFYHHDDSLGNDGTPGGSLDNKAFANNTCQLLWKQWYNQDYKDVDPAALHGGEPPQAYYQEYRDWTFFQHSDNTSGQKELARLHEQQQVVVSRMNNTKGAGYFGEADQNNSKGRNSTRVVATAATAAATATATATATQSTEAELFKAAGCGGYGPRTYTNYDNHTGYDYYTCGGGGGGGGGGCRGYRVKNQRINFSFQRAQVAIIAIFLASSGCLAFSPPASLRTNRAPLLSDDHQHFYPGHGALSSLNHQTLWGKSRDSLIQLAASKRRKKDPDSPGAYSYLLKKDRLPNEIYADPGERSTEGNLTKASWISWMRAGKPRGVEEVKMREALELGGVPRSDRYSSRDWFHNTCNLANSEILRAVRGPVIAMSSWASFLAIIYCYLLKTKPEAAAAMWIPSTVHSLMVSALGLLLVFRTNSAYQRFVEGRKIWGNIVNCSRDLYRYIMMYENEIGIDKRRRLQRLLAAYPFLLRHRVRPNLVMHRLDDELVERDPQNTLLLYQDRALPDNDPEAAAIANQEANEGKSRRNIRPLYWVDKRTLPWRLLPPGALEKCARAQNRPLWVCDRMAQEIRMVPDGPGWTNRERMTMISHVDKLSRLIGDCERIHQTSVPLNYARHSLRALTLWLFTLPFALVKDLKLLTGPALFLVSWLLFGVYEIGVAIEDPFQGTLRLSIICDIIRRDVLGDEIIRSTAFDMSDQESVKDDDEDDDEKGYYFDDDDGESENSSADKTVSVSTVAQTDANGKGITNPNRPHHHGV